MSKNELRGSNKQETMDLTHNQDKDLETIRYYHGTWKNFFDYWKKRGVKVDPYEGEEMIHPNKGARSNSKLPIQDFNTYDKAEMNSKITESFEQFKTEESINEGSNVKDAHKETRNVKSVKDPMYMFYVIKSYMGVGYWDRVKEKDFRKAFEEVLDFLISQNLNTRRMAEQYDWVITPDELWQYQIDKQD
jgi:hypothetical protein